jgi:hypothetical protein
VAADSPSSGDALAESLARLSVVDDLRAPSMGGGRVSFVGTWNGSWTEEDRHERAPGAG